MEDFHKCIERLHKTKSDAEKFAALLVLVKTLKIGGYELDHVQQKDIFDAVGSSFLQRLLHPHHDIDGCPQEIFRSVALTVLAVVSGSPKSPAHDFICSNLDTFKEILQSKESNSFQDLIEKDILQCLVNVCSTEEGRNGIISKQFVDYLVNVAINYLLDHEKAMHILMTLSHYFKSDLWTREAASFSAVINFIASEFREETTSRKFELCNILTKLLTDNPRCSADVHADWSKIIQEGLFDLLNNQLGKAQCRDALKLACAMVERFGLLWMLNSNDETKAIRKEFCFLIHLVCIEVQMILKDRSVEEIVENIDMLSACYTVLEATTPILCDESVWQIDSGAEQLLTPVNEAFRAVISFLLKATKEVDDWHGFSEHKQYLIVISVKALSAWLAEETIYLKEEVCIVIPNILKIGQCMFWDKKEEFLEGTCGKDTDVIWFLTPALHHMSADDAIRKVPQNASQLLVEYLDFQWLLWRKDMNKASETCIITLCGIFKNLVILEAKMTSESMLFFSLLKFLLNTVLHIPRGFEHITLKANITVLGLLIARQHSHKIKSCETSFCRFLAASVKFLWDCHQVEDSQDTSALVIMREYRKVWSEIMELWFLGMIALSNLLSHVPWVAPFLLESGWPQHIVLSLGKVSCNGVDASIKSAYQEFLCSLLRNCTDAKEQLLNCGGMSISQCHELRELGALLK
ncbi:neurochondrin homolog [Tachypleus tridentatus]|uniref:neurochondrin homolog n=1 Tax=Tachypleus tridentatus TaxID=6853 RepID=UPI003FD62472